MSLVLPFRSVPGTSGPSCLLLPSRGEPATDQPDGAGQVRDINPAYLEFVQTERNSWRGFGWVLGGGGGLMCLFMLAPLVWSMVHAAPKVGPLVAYGLSAFVMLLPLVGAFIAYRAARLPMAPVILSRRLRRFYYWKDRKSGWVSVDYDRAVALINMNVVATQAGGYVGFRLHVVDMEPADRRILTQIPVSEAARGHEVGCRLWEFIRHYMDRSPTQLPAVPYRPTPGDRASLYARIERDIYTGYVDAEHRLPPGFFHRFYFGFSAMLEYWYYRAMAWIERTAPRPALPPELAEAMRWEGDNPYTITSPTGLERDAMEGRLPQVNARWRVARVLSTLLYGGAFVGMVWMGWSMAAELG